MIPYILTALGGYLIGSSVKQYASGGLVYQFDYNCVYPSCGDELEFIIANMKPISANEFLRNVSLEEVNNSLMYGIKYESKARLKSDYGVSFYKLKKDGIDAYILVNSAIEYVFKKTSYASGGQVQLLAPNGKPSNLTPEQYKLVRTPEFKAWFGLADGTNTTFDGSNPDIRYERGGLMPNDTIIGKRIKLIAMNEEPYPVEPNTLGTIQSIDGIGQIHVKWDNGRSLAVVPDIDEYEII